MYVQSNFPGNIKKVRIPLTTFFELSFGQNFTYVTKCQCYYTLFAFLEAADQNLFCMCSSQKSWLQQSVTIGVFFVSFSLRKLYFYGLVFSTLRDVIKIIPTLLTRESQME